MREGLLTEINHSCVGHRMGCLDFITKNKNLIMTKRVFGKSKI